MALKPISETKHEERPGGSKPIQGVMEIAQSHILAAIWKKALKVMEKAGRDEVGPLMSLDEGSLAEGGISCSWGVGKRWYMEQELQNKEQCLGVIGKEAVSVVVHSSCSGSCRCHCSIPGKLSPQAHAWQIRKEAIAALIPSSSSEELAIAAAIASFLEKALYCPPLVGTHIQDTADFLHSCLQ